jgi:hypothetical protein
MSKKTSLMLQWARATVRGYIQSKKGIGRGRHNNW